MTREVKFPYDSPYDYQKEAYNAWLKNNCKGIFAMATGTGKTLTAINCIINESNKDGLLKNIFVVPGKELVNQWYKELKQCNFKNLFKWYSDNSSLKKDIKSMRILKSSRMINIIITYDSFISEKFLKIFKKELVNFTITFDEVHNLASPKRMDIIKDLRFTKLIGLSATPLRMWDEDEENIFIENMFNSFFPNYTFSYSMKEAINKKFLCKYYYFPYFVTLTDDEFDLYLEYTRQIPIGKDKINSIAAIKRQSVLDNAMKKNAVLLEIIEKLIKNNNHKFTLVYCPKGFDAEERRINNLITETKERFPNLEILPFLGESEKRPQRLLQFETGETDMLFAIKCLDEGVNIPRAENGIFLASGKNYREFVQRRGRLLRNFKNDNYIKTHANIHDIIVLPSIHHSKSNPKQSKKLIFSEFKRFLEFYNLSIFEASTYKIIESRLKKFDLTIEYIENKIREND